MSLTSEGKQVLKNLEMPWEKFKSLCEKHEQIPEIILALVAAESRGWSGAMRYEPNYRWLHEPEKHAKVWKVTVETEATLQKFSYGPLQIMGATARELGFNKHLALLLNAEVGLAWGIFYFAKLRRKYLTVADAVSAYNQGSPRKALMSNKYKNQKYVDRVLNFERSLFHV